MDPGSPNSLTRGYPERLGNVAEERGASTSKSKCKLKEESPLAAAKSSQIFSHAASFQRLASDLFKLQEAAMVLRGADEVCACVCVCVLCVASKPFLPIPSTL